MVVISELKIPGGKKRPKIFLRKGVEYEPFFLINVIWIFQFSGDSAKQMKTAYGVFCSGHLEALQLYKDNISKDRKFQAFIKVSSYKLRDILKLWNFSVAVFVTIPLPDNAAF